MMMTMQWEAETNPDRYIRDTAYRMHEDQAVLTWHWPDEIPCVYVYRAQPGQAFDPSDVNPQQLRLYTREEYKVNSGYHERIEGVGRFAYSIIPCLLEAGKPVMRIQPNSENVVLVSSGKSKIYYSIKTRKQWFGKFQSVQIEIITETPIPKEALCYVKKEGAYPARKDDGTQFAFIADFEPGRNIMPEIEIKKSEYIRLFFTDGRKYGELFELVRK